MIFNLNEQKVLSDPSGSSVFKGEKDFNDIVVNLPDEIDGHTATQLNYVMHFVDSDGGYSTKILNVDSSGETLKATATVSTNITSKAQAFAAFIIMTDDNKTIIGKTNPVTVIIHPIPSEENEIIPPADADKIIKGLEEIVKEATDTIEEATEAISSKQDKLTAGENITIENNVISAEGGGVTSYNDLTDKPQIKIKVQDAESTELGLVDVDIEGIFNLPYGFKLYYDSVGGKSLGLYKILTESLNDAKNFLVGQNIYSPYKYDFNTLSNDFRRAGMWEATALSCMHMPSFITSSFVSDFLIIHYYAHAHVAGGAPIARCVVGKDKDGDFRIFYQFIKLSNNNDGTITSQTDWVELTGGGSQIVSGVVNANGTITFTDSDGNTFTTTGSSVIGPQGDDYVLTAQDKSDIADIVLGELPNADTMSF